MHAGMASQSAKGLYVYDDYGRHDEAMPPDVSAMVNEVNELRQGMSGQRPLHDGRWGTATMEVVLAIAESSQQRKEVSLCFQAPAL